MAKAAPDPGTGPTTPSRKHKRGGEDLPGIIPIPSGTGTFPGATFVQALSVPGPSSSAASSSAASSSGGGIVKSGGGGASTSAPSAMTDSGSGAGGGGGWRWGWV